MGWFFLKATNSDYGLSKAYYLVENIVEFENVPSPTISAHNANKCSGEQGMIHYL